MPVEPKCCIISGKEVLSTGGFYNEIARKLGFPDHFGRNLDALYDVLTTDVEGPVELVWEDAAVSSEAMKDDFPRLQELLRQVASERDDFVVIFR